MYSTLALNNSKRSGNIVGTHQKLDKIARKILQKSLPPRVYFPDIKEILLFEGMGGPDGLKRKSPGVDEPMHFIIPGQDDGKLIQMILDHQYNLRKALATDNKVRAAFEAGWMAHAITDGLTPAHHFPLTEAQGELMTEKEFIKEDKNISTDEIVLVFQLRASCVVVIPWKPYVTTGFIGGLMVI